jgi:signal transduction histidine kinase
MRNGDFGGADDFSEPMANPGQDPARFLARADGRQEALRPMHDLFFPLQLQSSRSVGDKSWRSKEELMAILAHELRNPMMPIRCALEVIDRAKDDARAVARAYAIVKRQFAQMVRLLDDMLDAGSVAHGRIVLRKECIDLHGVLNSAVEAVKPLIDAKQHQLELELPLTPVHLHADGVKLIQIVTNLLTNAAKYTPSNGRIRLSAQRDSQRGEVWVRVLDTGIGIPAAQLHRIFDMFARVDDAHGECCEGLGIGLALARELATLHGGSISVHSDGPGLGSEFLLALPEAQSFL